MQKFDYRKKSWDSERIKQKQTCFHAFWQFAAGRLVNVNVESYPPLIKCRYSDHMAILWHSLDFLLIQVLTSHTIYLKVELFSFSRRGYHSSSNHHYPLQPFILNKSDTSHPAQQEIANRHHSSMAYFSLLIGLIFVYVHLRNSLIFILYTKGKKCLKRKSWSWVYV